MNVSDSYNGFDRIICIKILTGKNNVLIDIFIN